MADDKERIAIVEKLNKNLLVSASAGSGKTAMLVERMVAMVENEGVDISKVAAITFTKKAAGEFYDRFYKKLQLRTKENFDYKVDDKFTKLGNPGDNPKICKELAIERDKKALKEIDTCFFGTIDAFYQKILNEHPLEAGLSSNAKVIDDDEFDLYLISKFSEYVKSDNKDIREGALFFDENIGANKFGALIKPLIQNKDLEIGKIPLDLATAKKSFESTFELFKEGMKFIIKNGSLFKKFNTKKGVVTLSSKDKWEYLESHVNQLDNLSLDDYKNCKYIFAKCDLTINSEALGKLDPKFVDAFVTLKPKSANINSCQKDGLSNIVFVKVTKFLELVRNDVYESLVKDGLLTFSIATDYLYNLLKNDKEYKSTIEDIRNKIDHILLDECQDTDEKQYEIFFRLVASDYKKDYKELTIKGGKLYICGDRKQGIYHFRGADVSVFDKIVEVFKLKPKSDFEIITLTDNFRSVNENKIYFNDTFNRLIPGGYDPISNVEPIVKLTDDGVYEYSTDKDHDAENVSNIILDLVINKKLYEFKDFMVITSSKANILNYSKEFSKRKIPCYCEGNIDIHVSKLLDTIISLFKYIASKKKDKTSYFELLASDLFNFNFKNSIDLSTNYLKLIDVNESIDNFPSVLLEEISSKKMIVEKLGVKGFDILLGFIHLLEEKENKGEIQNYDDAIKYLTDIQKGDTKVERLSLLANNINAVQIANAHKTKGLEKSVVILTYAGLNTHGPSYCKDADKYYFISPTEEGDYAPILTNTFKKTIPAYNEEEKYSEGEEIRLLYVAATRAGKRLYISKFDRPGKWDRLIPDSPRLATITDVDTKPDFKKLDIKDELQINFNKDCSYKVVTPSKESSSTKFSESYESSTTDRDDALVFGSMVHKLLEYIIKAKDHVLDNSVCELITSSYDCNKFLDKLIKIKDTIYSGGYKQAQCPFNDLLKEAKNSECLTEVPFAFKNGNNITNGFIDLVSIKENKVIIIDYKTDSIEVDHTAQLNCYKESIEASGDFAGKEIESYIYLIKKE